MNQIGVIPLKVITLCAFASICISTEPLTLSGLEIIENNPENFYVYVPEEIRELCPEFEKNIEEIEYAYHVVKRRLKDDRSGNLKEYIKNLDSGDALITLDPATRGIKKKKVFCNLIVKKCLKTKNLRVTHNATIENDLVVKGNLTFNGSILTAEGTTINGCLTAECFTTAGLITGGSLKVNEGGEMVSENHSLNITSPSDGIGYGISISANAQDTKGLNVDGTSSFSGTLLVTPSLNTLNITEPLSGGYALSVEGNSVFKGELGIARADDEPAITFYDTSEPAVSQVQILYGIRDPNGMVSALRGSLYLRTTGVAYINTDGATAWSTLAFL